jgi:hypothetical protein
MRHLHGVDVPDLSEFVDVPIVLPVPEARQVAVRSALASVLRRRLAIHLQHSAAWPAEHAAHQHQVVHLDCGGGRLMRLVDALQDGRQQPIGRARQLGSGGDVGRADPANLCRPVRAAGGDLFGELVVPDRVRIENA